MCCHKIEKKITLMISPHQVKEINRTKVKDMSDRKIIQPILSLYILGRCDNASIRNKMIKYYHKNIISVKTVNCEHRFKNQKRLKKIYSWTLFPEKNNFIKLKNSKTIKHMELYHNNNPRKNIRLPPNLNTMIINEGISRFKLSILIKNIYIRLFAHDILSCKLPRKLETLNFKALHIQKIKTLLPCIKSLSFIYGYKNPLPKLHDGIEILEINRYYEFPINVLPKSLTLLKLCLADNYQHSTDFTNYLPQSLKFFQLDNCNIPLNNLPNNVEVLILLDKFNTPLINLPNNLKLLILGENFNCRFDVLPKSIENIILYNIEYGHIIHLLEIAPETIQNIYVFDRDMENILKQYKRLKQSRKPLKNKICNPLFDCQNPKLKLVSNISNCHSIEKHYKKLIVSQLSATFWHVQD